MTVRQALDWAFEELSNAVASPKAEAEAILGHITGCSRTELYLRPLAALSDAELASLEELVKQRRNLTPLQYLTGVQQFRGIAVEVGPGVLIPRPETEMVVDRALELIRDVPHALVADLGTGSGAIALALADERPDAEVWATEIDDSALEWARRNVQRSGPASVHLLAGDLLSPLPEHLKGRLDLVISNPPYLSESEFRTLPADVSDHEPRAALVSDMSGVEASVRVVRESLDWLKRGGWLVMETSPQRWADVEAVMQLHYREVQVLPDLSGRDRIAEGRKP